MKRVLSYYRLFIYALSFLLPGSICAQTDTFGLYIAPNATIYVNGTLQMTVGSKVINAGAFGTVQGSTVQMIGDYWRNNPGASFPDESGGFTGTGGTFRFGGAVGQQLLVAGFSYAGKTGVSFPNLSIANPFGVHLFQTDAVVRTQLHLETGLLWLNGNNLLVGQGISPGTITGYHENSFIATNNTTTGGYLYRPRISAASGSVAFPVGTQLGSYAPVSLMFNTTDAQDIGVRVWDNIYRFGTTGSTGNPASVQQTWHITHERPGKIASVVALQHLAAKEGAGFSSHRQNSYISRYDASQQTWDTVPPSGVTSPGPITNGFVNPASFLNTRSFDSLGHDTYLTKTADTRTDSITLAKAALVPVRQPDGSFAVTYQFIIQNRSALPMRGIELIDSLDNVFPEPAKYTVTSITTSGNLVANSAFDGSTVVDLLLPASTMTAYRTDTVVLTLNVVPGRNEAYYYNNALIKGIVQGFGGREYVVNNQSVDGITPPDPGAPPSPTPLALTPSKYAVPQGFSPNNDGVNDLFIIGNLGNDKAAVWIFNKQGVLVYRSADYKQNWDGTANQGGASSKKVEDGTYFYKITFTDVVTGKQETLYGYFSVWK